MLCSSLGAAIPYTVLFVFDFKSTFVVSLRLTKFMKNWKVTKRSLHVQKQYMKSRKKLASQKEKNQPPEPAALVSLVKRLRQ